MAFQNIPNFFSLKGRSTLKTAYSRGVPEHYIPSFRTTPKGIRTLSEIKEKINELVEEVLE